jgi:hypothetical protein
LIEGTVSINEINTFVTCCRFYAKNVNWAEIRNYRKVYRVIAAETGAAVWRILSSSNQNIILITTNVTLISAMKMQRKIL